MLKTIKNISDIGLATLKLKKSSSQLIQSKSQMAIIKLLGAEKGMALKFAQMIGSQKSDDSLQSVIEGTDITAIVLNDVIPVISERLGCSSDEVFETIEEAKWVASIGQVHPCTLKNHSGDYVIKFQYPGIKKVLKNQLKLMGVMGNIGDKTKLKKWGFDISDYITTFEGALDAETDYKIELANLQKFIHLNKTRSIKVPRPVEEYCTADLLVTTRMSGITIADFSKTATVQDKKRIAESFLINYLDQLLNDGFVQGDSHKGNFYIDQDEIVFLDFGHFLTLTAKEKTALFYLFHGVVNHDLSNELGILTELGFNLEKLHTIENRIPVLLETILAPFSQNIPYSFYDKDLKMQIDNIVGEEKWWFRASGNARFFQILRSLMGPYSIVKDLGIPVNWHQCAKEVLSKVSPVTSIIQVSSNEIKPIAKHLRIEVYKESIMTVDLTLPSRAIFNLEDLIDETVKSVIIREGLSIKDIMNKAIAQNVCPMTLFEFQQKNKKYKVYLK